jgi:hypothetical protein
MSRHQGNASFKIGRPVRELLTPEFETCITASIGRNWIHAIAHYVLLFTSFKKQQINTTEMNVVDSSRGPASRQLIDGRYAPARTSPGVAAPGFDVNKSPLWLPPRPAGDRLGRDIQREPDVLLGQSLAHGITLVVVPATGEREQFRFKVSEP